jgi:hypothetical protein
MNEFLRGKTSLTVRLIGVVRMESCLSVGTALLALAVGCSKAPDTPESPKLFAMPAESLGETDILPYTEGQITPGRNYIYCATFQLAWDQMEADVFKEPVELSGNPPMADALNRNTRPPIDLDDRSYIARAGLASSGIVDEVRREVEEKFPDAGFEIADLGPGAVSAAYAFLVKSLPFAEPFSQLKEPLAFTHEGGATKVKGFGFNRDIQEGALRVCSINSRF